LAPSDRDTRTSALTFLIVDAHPVLRRGLVAVLGAEFPGAAVLEAASYDEAVAGKPAPVDLVIADPNLGGIDATSAVSRLRRGLGAPILVFADNGDMRVLSQSLKAGARACVRKDADAGRLTQAIAAALAGEFYIDPALADGADYDGSDHEMSLTDRQREILQMYADGVITDAVAAALGLSTETVRTHTKRILAKLNASTRSHAVAIGVRTQLID
jgi:DNA-binding NarL/FixJ family response regulator